MARRLRRQRDHDIRRRTGRRDPREGPRVRDAARGAGHRRLRSGQYLERSDESLGSPARPGGGFLAGSNHAIAVTSDGYKRQTNMKRHIAGLVRSLTWAATIAVGAAPSTATGQAVRGIVTD